MEHIADYYLWVRVTKGTGSAAPIPKGHEVPDEVKKKYDDDISTKDPGKKPPSVVPDQLSAAAAKQAYVAMQLEPRSQLPGGLGLEFSLGPVYRSIDEATDWIFRDGSKWASEGQVHLVAMHDLRLS